MILKKLNINLNDIFINENDINNDIITFDDFMKEKMFYKNLLDRTMDYLRLYKKDVSEITIGLDDYLKNTGISLEDFNKLLKKVDISNSLHIDIKFDDVKKLITFKDLK